MIIGALHKSLHSQSRVTAASTAICLACYKYIKPSTVIDKLSLMQGKGGSYINIITTLSVTLTSVNTPLSN